MDQMTFGRDPLPKKTRKEAFLDEVLGDRAIAVMLVSGQARCNGVALERWRQTPDHRAPRRRSRRGPGPRPRA